MDVESGIKDFFEKLEVNSGYLANIIQADKIIFKPLFSFL